MPDYLYLLENQLSADQKNAVGKLREAARQHKTLLFLTGDVVRDLTSGHSVRELEAVVHGSALNLQKTIEDLGGSVWGRDDEARSLYLCFPGTVRVDLVSAHRTEFPKPGQPVYHFASIHEDLRRRDFTANAMAISLNDGSYGLLMDPTNGAADIEARQLRLVSNYGFLEDPSLLIRASRYRARLGWELETRTATRFGNACEEGVIEYLSEKARSRELEEVAHEEEALKVLETLENEGWMKVLFPAWSTAKADTEALAELRDLAVELLLQGVNADLSAAQMRLLTAKLAAKDLAQLKKLMLRPGFVKEWEDLDAMAAGFAKVLLAKENARPSAKYKIFLQYDPEAVLWLGFTSKDKAVLECFELFLKTWPEVRQHLPLALLQEMRITPDLADYNQILEKLFLELIDGNLQSAEEQKAFLEPFAPPAPPPQVSVKRSRAKRIVEPKVVATFDDEDGDDEVVAALDDDEDGFGELGGDDIELSLGEDEDEDLSSDGGDDLDDEDDEPELKPAPAPKAKSGAAKSKGKAAPVAKPAKKAASVKEVVHEKEVAKVASKASSAHGSAVKKAVSKPAPKAPAKAHPEPPSKKPAAKATQAAPAPAKASSAKAAPAKVAPVKPVPAKSAAKPKAPAKKSGAKKQAPTPPKKAAAKAGKKH